VPGLPNLRLSPTRLCDALIGRFLSRPSEGGAVYQALGNGPQRAVDASGRPLEEIYVPPPPSEWRKEPRGATGSWDPGAAAGPATGGLAMASEVLINGKTAVNINGTRFYITGSWQKGMWTPPSGPTSVLYVYKAADPTKIYRLDYGAFKYKGQLLDGWHHNQKGVAQAFGFKELNHVPAGRGARFAGRAIKVLRWARKPLIVVGVALSAYEVYRAEDKVRAVAGEVAGWGGAYLGAKAGAWGGGALGAKIGTLGGPKGTAIGAGVGAFIGGVGGGIPGFTAGREVVHYVYDRILERGEEETWIIYACEPLTPSATE